MPLDGIFLNHLKEELQITVGCRADKIHQPSKDELVLLLRSSSFTGKLLISARSGSSRVHITSASFDNPAEPPAFCKLIRKHLSSAKITAVEQIGLDRILIFRFMTYNEMGDTIYPFLVVELITGRANIILCDQNGRILDALKRSDIESSARLIQPGATYTLPESEEKLNPYTASVKDMAAAITNSARPLGGAFTAGIDGVSPLVSRELGGNITPDIDKSATDLTASEQESLEGVLLAFKEGLKSPAPYILKDTSGEGKDFCYLPITQYGSTISCERAKSFSALLDSFYLERDNKARIKAASLDILKLLNNLKNRTERKMQYRIQDLEKCKNREEYRIFGELLKANIYAIEKGASSARVQNYYSENLDFIDIPLDPAPSVSANAAKYFKEYKKTYTAEQTLTTLLENDKKELAYLESVLESLSRAQNAADLIEIKEELYDAGYIYKTQNQKRRVAVSKPREFISEGGFKILVGKNNRENDLLTTKMASKSDLWFHTKNIPGSHVVLFTEGKEVDEESLIFAASLAAGFSKAKEGENVPVDFTEIKNVKKPAGAKPGMVIYKANKTIYAKPFKEIL